VTPRDHITRLYELSQKTNQFNLNLERFSEVEMARLLQSPDHRVAVIGLSDRLSNSGLIGLLVAHREDETLAVRELAISCRALGRKLENPIVAEAIRAILRELPSREVCFFYRTGPRNNPAREWLARLTGAQLFSEGQIIATEALNRIAAETLPVTLELIKHEQLGNETASR
jgi:FkbH-like protein